MENITAADFMDSSPLAFGPDIGVIVALRQLLAANLSGAPVVDRDQRLVGFLSEADCLRGTLMGGYYGTVGELVRDRMTRQVESVAPATNIVDVAARFLDSNRRVLPVVQDGRVVGLIDRRGLLQVLLQQVDNKRRHVAA